MSTVQVQYCKLAHLLMYKSIKKFEFEYEIWILYMFNLCMCRAN